MTWVLEISLAMLALTIVTHACVVAALAVQCAKRDSGEAWKVAHEARQIARSALKFTEQAAVDTGCSVEQVKKLEERHRELERDVQAICQQTGVARKVVKF